MKSLKDIKAGDTFELTYGLPLTFGNVVASVKSQIGIMSDDEKTVTVVDTFTVEALADTVDQKRWKLKATSSQTALWPIDILVIDVMNTSVDGKIISTNKFSVRVTAGPTH